LTGRDGTSLVSRQWGQRDCAGGILDFQSVIE
jgi:hypothetical protein